MAREVTNVEKTADRCSVINGRLVINSEWVDGEDVIKAFEAERGRRTDSGRRVVGIQGIKAETIDRRKKYRKRELIGRDGKPIKVKEMPDRTKGGTPTYGGRRDALSKQIIFEQVQSVSEAFYKDKIIDIDPDDANWIVFDDFLLPPRWKRIARSSPLLISFPMEYPRLPPVGFYLRASLPTSANGHLYQKAYHCADQAPLAKEWNWYCVYIDAENWKPAPIRRPADWRRGDNLWEYITMINEALQSGD